MAGKPISTSNAPAAIGPYSQAIEAGGFIYCSGQIPLDPQSGEMVNSSVEAETEQVLINLTEVLKAAGLSLSDVVKTTVFIADMDDFAAINGVYARFFTENPPARACVEVSRLPKGARVEIEAVAAR